MKKLIAIVGTTASGKSDLGLRLATRYNGEIVSADSRQIYRGLDIGTGKETPEELASVPHHLIDILEPNEAFSVAEYQALAYEAIDQIIGRNKVPFLVGGTGLYTRCITEGYRLDDSSPNPELRDKLSTKNRNELIEILSQRGVSVTDPSASCRRLIRLIERTENGSAESLPNQPRYQVLQIGLTYERAVLNRRIEERLDRRLEAGMLDEARRLLAAGAKQDFLYSLGLEYRYMVRYLNGEFSDYEEFRTQLLTAIRQFAKRQMTWFRKDETIRWLDPNEDLDQQACQLIDQFLKK